jgi:hypothetical protein
MLNAFRREHKLEDRRSDEIRKRRMRCRLATVILAVAIALIGLGSLQIHSNPWRSRMLHGKPVMAQFYCGVQTVRDCTTSYKLIYQKRGQTWCEDVERSDQTGIDTSHSCNGNPEQKTISISGVIFTFDPRAVLVHLPAKMPLGRTNPKSREGSRICSSTRRAGSVHERGLNC